MNPNLIKLWDVDKGLDLTGDEMQELMDLNCNAHCPRKEGETSQPLPLYDEIRVLRPQV